MSFIEKNIPQEMKAKKQWVCYRKRDFGGKVIKQMFNPLKMNFAKSNDPNTWSTFLTASKVLKNPRNHLDGMAFVLTEGYVFIDTDHSIDENGNINEISRKLLDIFDGTYAERSCSGHGIHIICKGKMPKDAKKRNDSLGIEIYETKRFLCMTGDIIEGRKEIKDCFDEVDEVCRNIVGINPPYVPIARGIPTMSDAALIERIRKSGQGAKFDALYRGDMSAYHSASNADYALARILTFWTEDANQIKSIMKSSGLVRDKYDRPLGNSTYLDVTIEHALAMSQRRYGEQYEL